MFGVGKDLCGSSSPTPCQSRVTYSRLHRTLSKQVLNISREGRFVLGVQQTQLLFFRVHSGPAEPAPCGAAHVLVLAAARGRMASNLEATGKKQCHK